MTSASIAAKPSAAPRPTLYAFVGVLAVWGVAVAALSSSGLARTFPPRLIPVPIAGGMAAILVAYAVRPRFRRLLRGVDISSLTTFHVWRVPAALVFFWYGAQGLLPATFVQRAAWGDLLAGLFGLVTPLLLPPGTRHRRAGFLAFHLFSFADFVSAVGTGLWFTIGADPLMANIRTFPLALIPLWGVPITGALSLIALHRLLTERAPEATREA